MNKQLCGLAIVGLLVVSASAAPSGASAQGKQRRVRAPGAASPAPSAPAASAPRTVKGSMRGNVIAVRNVNDRPAFAYTLTGARVVNGKLELQGTTRPAAAKGGAGAAASATLVGTLAMHRRPEEEQSRAEAEPQTTKPEPAAGDPPAQQQGGQAATPETAGQLGQLAQSTQSTARQTPTPTAPDGEQPEKGESLTEHVAEAPVDTKPLAGGTGVTGCELLYLKMELPAQMAAAAGGRTVQLNVSLAQLDNKAGEDLNQHICRVVRALDSNKGTADTEVAALNAMLGGAK
jgi:hypothetical protein